MPRKRPRRKLVLQQEDDEEIESDEEVKKKVALQDVKPIVDEICHKITNSAGVEDLKGLKFGSLSIGEKEKVEDAILEMLCIFKMLPIQLESRIPKELSNRLAQKVGICS